uniref:Uncharacterized protein n=1 Tax=Emiliania huxleyi TaxID=2903 RepID=A0A7S3W5C4_EMIHU|mmetsp:Transcript_9954/g.29655  ORF Transcript_9954/g.29655 Transcript_9954/m.29655 type:complete len:235 (-) Transcript_9954:148-852(-)
MLNGRFALSKADVGVQLQGAGLPVHMCERSDCQLRPMISTSLIGRGHHRIFLKGGRNACEPMPQCRSSRVGLVLSPAALQERLRCSYPSDGRTNAKVCGSAEQDSGDPRFPLTSMGWESGGECAAGCGPGWCDEWSDVWQGWRCAYRPRHLSRMLVLQAQHNPFSWNEVVFDGTGYETPRPPLILAFLVASDRSEEELSHARELHTQYVQRYPEAASVPLVQYHEYDDRPFELV